MRAMGVDDCYILNVERAMGVVDCYVLNLVRALGQLIVTFSTL